MSFSRSHYHIGPELNPEMDTLPLDREGERGRDRQELEWKLVFGTAGWTLMDKDCSWQICTTQMPSSDLWLVFRADYKPTDYREGCVPFWTTGFLC